MIAFQVAQVSVWWSNMLEEFTFWSLGTLAKISFEYGL